MFGIADSNHYAGVQHVTVVVQNTLIIHVVSAADRTCSLERFFCSNTANIIA